jgi:hypothetical protein
LTLTVPGHRHAGPLDLIPDPLGLERHTPSSLQALEGRHLMLPHWVKNPEYSLYSASPNPSHKVFGKKEEVNRGNAMIKGAFTLLRNVLMALSTFFVESRYRWLGWIGSSVAEEARPS